MKSKPTKTMTKPTKTIAPLIRTEPLSTGGKFPSTKNLVALLAISVCWADAAPPVPQWQVVVNNGVTVPGDPSNRKYNSYNQPSLNVDQLVVFRARSKGGNSGEPAHGIYTRDMALGTPVSRAFDRNTAVPYPNNLGTTFIEPPSFPRIDMWSPTIASRGVHPPVWRYLLGDDTETRAGTTGIYTNPFGSLITGASNLGEVPAFPFFSVPGSPGIKFDVFPGAPAVSDSATIAFKGNYAVPDPADPNATIGKTGVFYRNLGPGPTGGTSPSVLIANTDTLIPGSSNPFGSTAPPSTAGRLAVFAGFDNEDAPTLGGIYLAPLSGTSPALTTLVAIGTQVPGEKKGVGFNKLGEGVSFDGRFVAFWGAWGTETKTLLLQCPTDGNKERIQYCMELYPDGFTTSVPLNQGIFVHDIKTRKTVAVAKTPGDFDDFVYWNFSGRVPGTGEGDDTGELARWRSGSFVAVSGLVDGSLKDAGFHAAFKATTGQLDNGTYVNPVDGIYLRKGPENASITTVVATGMNGVQFDPAAIDPDTGVPLPVTSMGIERDGFRGKSLAIAISMGTEEAGWAGIYMSRVSKDGRLSKKDRDDDDRDGRDGGRD